MWNKKRYLLAAFYSIAVLSQRGFCESIIIDADAFPAGTVLTNSFPGVTLRTLDEAAPGVNPRDVTSGNASNATTGSRAFAHDGTNTSWGNGSFEFFRADFLNGARSVSLDFYSDDAPPSAGDFRAELLAFDLSDILLDAASAEFVPLGSPVRLTVTAPNIAYIAAYWDESQRTSRGGLDRLEYLEAIPEPMTLAMFGLSWSILLSPHSRGARTVGPG